MTFELYNSKARRSVTIKDGRGRTRAHNMQSTTLRKTAVAILTGGRDPHYALGLASAVAAQGVQIDLVGGDHMAETQFESHSSIKFVVIREQGPTDSQLVKA